MKKKNEEQFCKVLGRKFRKSPIFFIEKMWGLTPQPLKPEYREIAEKSSLQEYQAEWFEPFVRGEHITYHFTGSREKITNELQEKKIFSYSLDFVS